MQCSQHAALQYFPLPSRKSDCTQLMILGKVGTILLAAMLQACKLRVDACIRYRVQIP